MSRGRDAHEGQAAPRGRSTRDVTSWDGTRLAVTTWGAGDRPVVVLVHGLGLSTESWGQVPELLAQHHVVAYDMRGHAQSGDAKTGDYSMKAHAHDLDAVLRAVVPDGRKAVVVGNSLGGGIVVAHAHHFGTRRVAGAVFAGSGGSGVTFAGFPADRVPAPVRAAERTAWLKALRMTALVGRRLRPVQAVSDRIVRHMAFAPGADQEHVAHVRDSFLTSRPAALAPTTLASVSHDGTRMAPDLDVPVLVLHGSADPEVPDREVGQLMSALPQREQITLPRAGHMLPLTDPEFVADHVAQWVSRVGLGN